MSSINQHPKILNEFAALVGLQQGLLRGADTFLLKILEFNRTPTSSIDCLVASSFWTWFTN